MKGNRFLSLVLCAALIFTLLPVSALADSVPGSFVFDVGEGNIVIATGTDAGTLKVTYGASPTTTDDFPNTQNITITGTTTSNTIRVESDVTASITLDDVDIQVLECAFIMVGATVDLTLTGINTLKSSGDDYAGLWCPAGAVLTIGGAGSLAATGGKHGAGVGGGDSGAGGKVTINGGTVTGNSDAYGAGIGGGGTVRRRRQSHHQRRHGCGHRRPRGRRGHRQRCRRLYPQFATGRYSNHHRRYGRGHRRKWEPWRRGHRQWRLQRRCWRRRRGGLYFRRQHQGGGGRRRAANRTRGTRLIRSYHA